MANRGSADHAPSGRPRAAAASAKLARRLAASAVSAALQPALAVPLSGARIAGGGHRAYDDAVFHAAASPRRRAGYSQHAVCIGRSAARHAAVPVCLVRPRLGAKRRTAAQATESRQAAQDSDARAGPAARHGGRALRAAVERRGFLAVARSRLRRAGSQGRHARHDSGGGPDGRWHGDHARLVPAEHPEPAGKRLMPLSGGPDSARLAGELFASGTAKRKAGRLTEALADFSRTAELKPHDPSCLLQAAEVAELVRKPQLALEYCGRLRGGAPELDVTDMLEAQIRFGGEHYLQVMARILDAVKPRTYVEIGVEHGTSLRLVQAQRSAEIGRAHV